MADLPAGAYGGGAGAKAGERNCVTMRKAVLLGAVLLLALAVSACGGKSQAVDVNQLADELLEQVEFEIDTMDDQIEYAARAGSLPWNQYYELERSLDMLDHRLDMAEDSLQWRLRVDD